MVGRAVVLHINDLLSMSSALKHFSAAIVWQSKVIGSLRDTRSTQQRHAYEKRGAALAVCIYRRTDLISDRLRQHKMRISYNFRCTY